MNYYQTNWVTLLSVAQITYNISINQTTDTTSFFVNHEYNANLFLESKKAIILTEQVSVIIKNMQNLHKELKKNINFLSHQSAFYYNKYHAGAPMLKERNKVYFLQKNIEITRSSNKLNHIKIRPFKIIRNIKEISYKLNLSKSMQQRHSVFHVSLLETALKEVSILTQISDNYLMKKKGWYKVK